MKIEITKTEDLYEIGGLMVRRWEGVLEDGLCCDVIVQSVRPKPEASEAEAAALGRAMAAPLLVQPSHKPQEDWTRADWLHHTGTEGPYGD